MTSYPPTWLIEAANTFRNIGFFASQSSLSDIDLAQWIASHFKLIPSDRENWEDDRIIVALDKDRVWWEDGETDIAPGDYTNILTAWSKISRGKFQPVNIKENWLDSASYTDRYLSAITFELDGQSYNVYPSPMYGWIDFLLLNQINDIIAPTGYFYQNYPTMDQTTFLIVINNKERRLLTDDLQWVESVTIEEIMEYTNRDHEARWEWARRDNENELYSPQYEIIEDNVSMD